MDEYFLLYKFPDEYHMNDEFSDDDLNKKFSKLFEEMFGVNIDQFIKNFMNNPKFKKEFADNLSNLGFDFSIYPSNMPKINPVGMNSNLISMNDEKIPIKDFDFEVIEDTNNEIIIIGEINGFSKEEIHVGSKDRKIIIKGSNISNKFVKEIEVQKFDQNLVQVKFRNGILEIKLKKIEI